MLILIIFYSSQVQKVDRERTKSRPRRQITRAFEQEQCEDNELLEEPDKSRLPEEFMENIPKDEPFKFKAIKLPEKEQMTKDVRELSFEQKVVFDRFFSYCKRKSMSQSKYCMNIQPERMIVHGS